MRTVIVRLLLVALSAILITASGCQQKKPATETGDSSAVTDSSIGADMTDSDSGNAMGLVTVRFAYDSAVLDSGAKAALKKNAQVLKDKASLKAQVEGHTDERGGIQYNIALGERRANAAKAFLVDHGVPSDRLTTITYGKEKPVDMGHDETAWSKNRRANFRITEK